MGKANTNPLDAALKRLEPITGSASTWTIKAHLMTLELPKHDYFAARIAREPEIRDAISECCREWIRGRQFRPFDVELGFFFYDRFYYGHVFGSWLQESGASFESKTEPEILAWLLIDSWERVSLVLWIRDLSAA